MYDLTIITTLPVGKGGGGAERVNKVIVEYLKERYEVRVIVPLSTLNLVLGSSVELSEDQVEDFVRSVSEFDVEWGSCLENLMRRCKVRANQLLTELGCLREYKRCKISSKASLNLNANHVGPSLVDLKAVESDVRLGYLHDFLALNPPVGRFYPYPEFGRRADPVIRKTASSLPPGPPWYQDTSLINSLLSRANHALSHLLIKRYLRSLDLLFVPSPGALLEYPLLKMLNVRTLRVCAPISFNALPTGVRASTASDKDKYYVFGSSLVSVGKGILDVLFAWKYLNIDADLIVPGAFPSPAFQNSLIKLVEKLGLVGKISYVSKLEHKSFLGLVASSEGVVLPSYFDNCPVTVAEALALSTPAIIYDYPPVKHAMTLLSARLQREGLLHVVPLGNFIELGLTVERVRRPPSASPTELSTTREFFQELTEALDKYLR
jgi:glycosyltransferase involved in cell wall biosynthesis